MSHTHITHTRITHHTSHITHHRFPKKHDIPRYIFTFDGNKTDFTDTDYSLLVNEISNRFGSNRVMTSQFVTSSVVDGFGTWCVCVCDVCVWCVMCVCVCVCMCLCVFVGGYVLCVCSVCDTSSHICVFFTYTSVPLSLSLSLTHTHTSTHIKTGCWRLICSLLVIIRMTIFGGCWRSCFIIAMAQVFVMCDVWCVMCDVWCVMCDASLLCIALCVCVCYIVPYCMLSYHTLKYHTHRTSHTAPHTHHTHITHTSHTHITHKNTNTQHIHHTSLSLHHITVFVF